MDGQPGGVEGAAHLRARRRPRLTRQDRLAYGGIVASALACLALLAWGHLGLGALLFPPALANADRSVHVAQVGDITIGLREDTAPLTAGGPNEVALTVQGPDGQPLDGLLVLVQPRMTSMDMGVPAAVATAEGGGRYTAHPKFGMAGDWQLVVTVTPRDGAPLQASFAVGVRWQ